MKKVFKAIVLTIVLGVPVFWYLFLQLFGENKFELPTIGRLSNSCQAESFTLYLLKDSLTIGQENELSRLSQEFESSEIDFRLWKGDKDCIDQFEGQLLLVGDSNSVKGNYELTAEEVDRAITESDLLLHLNEK